MLRVILNNPYTGPKETKILSLDGIKIWLDDNKVETMEIKYLVFECNHRETQQILTNKEIKKREKRERQ